MKKNPSNFYIWLFDEENPKKKWHEIFHRKPQSPTIPRLANCPIGSQSPNIIGFAQDQEIKAKNEWTGLVYPIRSEALHIVACRIPLFCYYIRGQMDPISDRVKKIVGCPGTAKGLIFRLLQLVISIVCLSTLIKDEFRYLFRFHCFKFFVAGLGLQGICSFILAIRDIDALIRMVDLLSPTRVGCYIFWDFITFVIVWSGASSSAALGSLFYSHNKDCLPYGQRAGQNYPSCGSFMLPVVISVLGLVITAMTGIGNIRVLKIIWTPERQSPAMSRKEVVVKLATPAIMLGIAFWACFWLIPQKFLSNHVCRNCHLN